MSTVIISEHSRSGLVDDEPLYEIINGQRVDLPPMSILASQVSSLLMVELGVFVRLKRPGMVLTETLLRLPLPDDRNRRPDLAYVSNERMAAARSQPGSDNAWDIVPELMVEVISPHDLAEDILERLDDYWAAGTRLVWVVYPTSRLIYVYEARRQVKILGEGDQLEGGDVLPGLRIDITSLFPA